MRVVVDTNVVVSAYLSPFGPPAQVMAMLFTGKISAVMDERIFAEYRDVLLRPRFGIPVASVESLLDYLSSEAEFVAPEPISVVLPDPTDLAFLEVAVAGQVDAIVTGNLRHFPQRTIARLGVNVCTPAQLLQRV